MSLEDLKAELEKRAKEAVIAEIQNLPELVRGLAAQNATKLLLAALGFTESFGRWEIARNNEGASAIARALGNVALQQIQLAIPDFLKGYMEDLKAQEFMQGAGRKDYKYQFNRLCCDHVDKWITEEAKTKSQEIIEALKAQDKNNVRR